MSPDEAARALQCMSLQELRQEWRRRFGAPPKLRSPDLIRQGLSWLIQTKAYGGITPPLRRKIRGEAAISQGLELGARIIREWQGGHHEVEVVDGGYLYSGRIWKSLSAIAFEITGVKWNGPRFFGQRDNP